MLCQRNFNLSCFYMHLINCYLERFAVRAFAIVAIALAGLPGRAANLVVNPGFETGDLTGWIVSPDSSSGCSCYGVDNLQPHSGAYEAYFGPIGDVVDLSQSLATVPGTAYTVSFWLAQTQDPYPPDYINSIAASFGSNGLLSETDAPASDYVEYSSTGLVATSSSTSLIFAFRNDDGYFLLDDVSVAPLMASVPEPATAWLIGLILTHLAPCAGHILAQAGIVGYSPPARVRANGAPLSSSWDHRPPSPSQRQRPCPHASIEVERRSARVSQG